MEFPLTENDPYRVFGLPKKMLMEVSIHFISLVPTGSRDDMCFRGRREIAEAEGESESFASRGNWDHSPSTFSYLYFIVSTTIKAAHSRSRGDNRDH